MLTSLALLVILSPCIYVIATCGTTLTSQSGTVKSANYPRNYPDNSDCTWTINIPGVSKIKLTFSSVFNIEAANGCGYDYVQAYQLAGTRRTLLGKWCGPTSPGVKTVNSNNAQIRFVSDGSVQGQGFSIQYTAVVDGGWSAWSNYTADEPCSTTCGRGTQQHSQTRTCTNPSPMGGGASCPGSTIATLNLYCTIRECPVDGNWSSWSDYTPGACSVSCGSGYRVETRTRTCNNPAPAFGGENCTGDDVETRETNCALLPCPINGNWSSWSDYTPGACSVSCGSGYQVDSKTRICNNPAPEFGGETCIGDEVSTRETNCTMNPCPINGNWSSWSDYTPGACSVSCGSGYHVDSKTRICNNPAPAFGGESCTGDDVETRETNCTMSPCPIDGGWGDWSGWIKEETCSVTCGAGLVAEKRSRTCNNPEPMHRGAACTGQPEEGRRVECSERECQGDCAVDGTKLTYARDFTKYYECLSNEKILKACGYGYRWEQSSSSCVKICTSFRAELVAHPLDCYKFVQCVWGMSIVISCPDGTAWSTASQVCVHIDGADCS